MLTLELPASDIPLPTSANSLADNSLPFDADDNGSNGQTTAQAAADLLDQGEAEAEPVNDAIDETTGPTDVGGDLETTLEAATEQAEQPAEGEKKKRKRKAKAADDQLGDAGQAVAPAPPAPPADPQPENLQAADLLDEIARAETACEEAESGVLSLKEELKAAKKEYEGAVHRLRKLCRALENDSSRPLFTSESPPAAAVDGSTGQTTKQADDSAKMNVVADANVGQRSSLTATASGEVNRDPDIWRKVSVESLGLPPKLAEKLAEDGLDTIGRLEDRRAEISQGREKWPKGIGAAKVTLIEDAVIKWLTANRDSQMFKPEAMKAAATEVSQPATMQDDTMLTAQSQDTSPAAGSDATKPLGFAGQWEDLSAEAQRAFITDRSAAINNGEENCLARKHPDTEKFYDAGYCSYSEEVDGEKTKLTDCVYVPGVEQDDWLRGFMAAKKVDQYEPGEAVKEDAVKPAATTITDPDLYDLDTL